MSKLSPLESEFATTEEAEAYDRWLHQKVERAMTDERPKTAHDEAMAKTRALIEEKRRAASRLGR